MLAQVRHRLERFLEILVMAIMAALAILVVAGVVFRKAGNPLVWYDEVASVLLAWLTYYGAALAALRRAHIGFPVLVRRFRPPLRVAVAMLVEAVVLLFFMVLAWAGWRVLEILEGETLISLPSVPSRLAQSVIPIGALLFIVAELLSLPAVLQEARAAGPHDGGTRPA